MTSAWIRRIASLLIALATWGVLFFVWAGPRPHPEYAAKTRYRLLPGLW